MPTPSPNSRYQVLTSLGSSHVVPVIDLDRPDLTHLVAPINASGVIGGSGAPTSTIAAVAATLVADSVAVNADLTFTAVVAGAAGNDWQIEIVQGTGASVPLSVEVVGKVATITLPTDGGSTPVAKTATEVKAAWDAHAIVSAITVAAEGTGAGTVDGSVLANMASGADAVPGTGAGQGGPGTLYVDTAGPTLYANTGTSAAPVWTAV